MPTPSGWCVQRTVANPADGLWLLDTASPLFQPTEHGGPQLVCVDLTTARVAQTTLFPTDVALLTTDLTDVWLDRRGAARTAVPTDSSDSGPNRIIVMDLATGDRRPWLYDHSTTTAEVPPDLRQIIEGQDFVERSENGSTSPVRMGSDGLAIAANGGRLYYCPLSSRRWGSVSIDALADRCTDDGEVAATVTDEGHEHPMEDVMETDDRGQLYVTSGRGWASP